MEVFAILLSIPASLIATFGYRYLLARWVGRWAWITPLFLRASYAVLALLVLEWVILILLGAVRGRTLLGAAFDGIHMVSFVFGAPALVNVFVLSDPAKYRERWFVTVFLSSLLAVVLVIQQYAVSEEFWGVDGDGGAFGQPADHN